MPNSFLFIVPLTPASHMTPLRKELQKRCFESLLNQKNQNWNAMIIGVDKPEGVDDTHFIHINQEGYKEFKLQLATKYIRDNSLKYDYQLLEQIKVGIQA